ncbi:hypothetical protein PJF56_12520 [Roseofilum sp. BLCC_M91]|uniref:SpoVT-AbrB domain-containing protein n=1 Tax=Roseofilum halophilum BLCC-M91 TaxID=3022259 RepID=A0ABT7BKG8_9CYAN|nr:hypothetical protein [Roseofilum halophilum]MDJ1179688.1 hypothetical protein [Roseofilum halophilum BLCC-M91]
MTGHHKFSQLTAHFSESRKAKIAAKTEQIKKEMAFTQITPSGEIALPPEIIDWLQLKPGDSIHFAISPDGKVYLEPAKI